MEDDKGFEDDLPGFGARGVEGLNEGGGDGVYRLRTDTESRFPEIKDKKDEK